MGVGGWIHAPVPIAQDAGCARVCTGTENPPVAEFDPLTVEAVASRYTDWAIPAHKRGSGLTT